MAALRSPTGHGAHPLGSDLQARSASAAWPEDRPRTGAPYVGLADRVAARGQNVQVIMAWVEGGPPPAAEYVASAAGLSWSVSTHIP